MPNIESVITLQPGTTALVLIDLQKGIASFPTEPYSSKEVIENAVKLRDAFRAANSFVVPVRVAAAADGKDMLSPIVDEPLTRRSSNIAKGWSDIVDELSDQNNDLVITKKQWGAFYGTELDLQLRRRGIKTIVLCGIATNFGVESTARDAFERGYDLIFAEDAMAAMNKQDHEFALVRIFPRIGRVRSSDAIIKALSV